MIDVLSVVEDAQESSDLYSGWGKALTKRVEGGKYSLAVKENNVGDSDEWETEEAYIALVLALALSYKADTIIEIVDKGLIGNFDRLPAAVEEATVVAGTVYTDKQEKLVKASLSQLIGKGAAKLSARDIINQQAKASVLEGMIRATKYYTHAYFNTQVVPELYRQVEKVIDGVPGSSLAHVREILDKRLNSTPYWKTVANVASSRSYHYGMLKAASTQGLRAYQFTAILDERTTTICRELHGSTWFLQPALQKMEQMARTDDIEEIKQMMPFFYDSDAIADFSDADLEAMGVAIPPVHGNCRSTIILV